MPRNFLIGITLLVGMSCTDQLAYFKYQSTDNGKWGKDQLMEFSFSDLDSTRAYNMYITLRNDEQYPYSNLFLIAEMTGPDGTSERDTLEYEMTDASGKWMGTGYGSVKENKLWYRENIVFPDSGVYNVTVSHAMRRNGSVEGIQELPGVLDVGLQIEKKQ
ncbi:MAG: gliding motility lipoprotein GldH [Robiginitalea sp.]|jgi:gliding motility-associated lipoprotein GldH